MSRNSDGEFQINFITNGFLRSLRGYEAVGKFPIGAMHEVTEFSPIDSTALAVLKLVQTDRRFTVFHACNSHHIYMADLIYAMPVSYTHLDVYKRQAMSSMLKTKYVSEISVISQSGVNKIAEFNHTENEFDRSKTISDMFDELAETIPDHTAVVFKERKYTYKELDELSNRLGKYIASQGIGREDVVSILIPRCEYMAIAPMGVIKAGAA